MTASNTGCRARKRAPWHSGLLALGLLGILGLTGCQIDVGGQTLTDGWNTGTHQELMAIESLVQTLVANFEGAHRVRILVNGSPAETLGGHVSLSRSLGPMPSLVSAR